MGFPIARPFEAEDLGPLGEAIQDGMGHGIIMEHLVPLADDAVGGDHRGLPLVMPGRDYMEDQMTHGLAQGHITDLVD